MELSLHEHKFTIAGPHFTKGATAPDFQAIASSSPLGPPTQEILKSFQGKKILTSFPSIDTGTCQLQLQRFNKEAESRGVPVIVLSCDLPFAQSRGCEAFKAESVHTFSDFALHDFGKKYGLLLKEIPLLARAVYVLDEKNTILYFEIGKEITAELDYDKALSFL